MLARSSALALALVLAACDPKPTAGPVTVAPAVVPYTCAQQHQASAELATLPPAAMLGVMMGDYMAMRDQVRAARKDPAPTPCPGS